MNSNEFKEVYLNNSTYNLTSYTSDWISSPSFQYATLTVYCSSNCNIYIEFAVDDNYQIIATDTDIVIGGSSNTIRTLIKTRYLRFRIDSIAIQPSILIVQSFYTN